MSNYKENPTQEQRILNLLGERGSKGAEIWEFMLSRRRGGLGIAQYNARIKGLRDKGHIIKNVTPGHFVLDSEVKEEVTEPVKSKHAKFYYIQSKSDDSKVHTVIHLPTGLWHCSCAYFTFNEARLKRESKQVTCKHIEEGKKNDI